MYLYIAIGVCGNLSNFILDFGKSSAWKCNYMGSLWEREKWNKKNLKKKVKKERRKEQWLERDGAEHKSKGPEKSRMMPQMWSA